MNHAWRPHVELWVHVRDVGNLESRKKRSAKPSASQTSQVLYQLSKASIA